MHTHEIGAKNIAYLDGWRGLAISALLIGHFLPFPGINFGAVGVNLFFVLSGLLMGSLLFEKHEPIARFYRRRIARIIPAHLTFVALVTVIYAVIGIPINYRELLAALFFVNNYVGPEGGPGTALLPFGHIWSLSVEEHCYVALSIIAIAARKRLFSASTGVGILLIVCVSLVLLYQWFNPLGLVHTYWLQTEVASFGLLVTALWTSVGRPFPSKRLPAALAPVLIAVGIALHWWSIPPALQRLLGVGCFAMAICTLTVTAGWYASLLSWAPLRQIGLCSYSLYLWQQPFYLWLHGDEHRSSLLALALALTCGLVSYYVVERPARRYLNKHWRARKSDA